MEKTICISLGGSTIIRDASLNYGFMREFVNLLAKNTSTRFVVVVGGGKTAKGYIGWARELVSNKFYLDELGILISKANALIMAALAMQKCDAYPKVVESYDELKTALQLNRIVFMAGMTPGITTDAVATLACEAVDCKLLVNISKTAYVYDGNPNAKDSKKMRNLSHEELIELAVKFDGREPKSDFVFDIIASKIAKRSGIRINFCDDRISNIKNAMYGKAHEGSRVF